MNQQSLLDELSAIIRRGLEERQVPLTRPGWVIEWDADSGTWRLTVRLQPGLPLLVADNQLVVFREEEEIRPILQFLPLALTKAAIGSAIRGQLADLDTLDKLRAERRADPEETLFSAQGEFKFLKEAFAKAGRAEGLIEFSAADGQTNAEPQNVKKATVILRELQGDIAVRMDENRRRVDR